MLEPIIDELSELEGSMIDAHTRSFVTIGGDIKNPLKFVTVFRIKRFIKTIKSVLLLGLYNQMTRIVTLELTRNGNPEARLALNNILKEFGTAPDLNSVTIEK